MLYYRILITYYKLWYNTIRYYTILYYTTLYSTILYYALPYYSYYTIFIVYYILNYRLMSILLYISLYYIDKNIHDLLKSSSMPKFIFFISYFVYFYLGIWMIRYNTILYDAIIYYTILYYTILHSTTLPIRYCTILCLQYTIYSTISGCLYSCIYHYTI